MATTRRTNKRKVATPNRARTRNLVIRLSDEEREMVAAVSEDLGMNATQTIRWLVRERFEQRRERK